MNVYTHNGFNGHWPVPTAAVVVANSREEAAQLLGAALESRGLGQKIDKDDFVQVEVGASAAVILSDGEY